ncbi:MAG: twin-arginine translocation signal domain-containing protein [Candidatus Hydrogenedens sp.]|nr:metallophosphoesterase [Candidatus Hydrogenedentota bacterium]NLF59449.1 twin-arginine translocation signal domain-containing protein [Candidatus Hydrogenedens sp.]
MNQLTRRGFLRAGAAGALAAAVSGGHLLGGAEPFTLAVINDTHVTNAASTGLLDLAVEQLNADSRVELVVVAGDLASLGSEGELALAKKSLDRLKAPFLAVPGNHDVAPKGENPLSAYAALFGEPHWVREAGGWTLVGLNSCEGTKSDVTVSAGELDWLRGTLSTTDAARPVAFFCHHPLNPNTKAYRIKNAEEILGTFADRKLRVAAAGHWHGNQVEERDGVLFATTACCAATRDNFDGTAEKGYRLFHLGEDRAETEFVAVAPPTSPPAPPA